MPDSHSLLQLDYILQEKWLQGFFNKWANCSYNLSDCKENRGGLFVPNEKFSRVHQSGIEAVCNWPSIGVKRLAYALKTDNLFVPPHS